jgi:hypothetical protein
MRTQRILILTITAGGVVATAGVAHAQSFVPLPPPAEGGRVVPPAPDGWAYRWIPARYDWVTRRVWIEGRTEWVREWVEIRSHMEEVWRQITSPGHWEERSERVMVNPGRWELVRIGPPYPVEPRPGPFPLPHPIESPSGTVGVEGYARGGGEDLSKFSGLREWPK